MTLLPDYLLAELFRGNPRAVSAFRELDQMVDATDQAVTSGQAATDRLSEASFVTLSPNGELPNEKVLAVGRGLTISVEGDEVVLRLGIGSVRVSGDFDVAMTAQGPTAVVLPLAGVLATLGNIETLSNKTLASPKVTGLGDYADDTAAATGGVAVGSLYRTGSAVKVRIA